MRPWRHGQSANALPFEHPGFAALGPIVFRLTRDDRIAAMALSVDNNDVVLPLRSVASLFGIRADTADGQMLGLVEQGLRFVPTLQVGDALPSEVLTGEASWEPSAYHRQVASARLQLQLVNWIGGMTECEDGRVTSQMLLVSVEDPAIRPRVQEALRQAAIELGIEGGGPAVAALVEQLAHELSYIEALRERLLERVRAIGKGLVRAGQDNPGLAPGRRETLFQVVRLASTALLQIVAGFEEVDGQTVSIMPALRNLDQQRNFVRPHRDRLYCTYLAWEPIFRSWQTVTDGVGREQDGFWRVVDEVYRFLAPQFMPVQEWQTLLAARRQNGAEQGRPGLVRSAAGRTVAREDPTNRRDRSPRSKAEKGRRPPETPPSCR